VGIFVPAVSPTNSLNENFFQYQISSSFISSLIWEILSFPWRATQHYVLGGLECNTPNNWSFILCCRSVPQTETPFPFPEYKVQYAFNNETENQRYLAVIKLNAM